MALGLCLAILVLLCINIQTWHTPLHISYGEDFDAFNPFSGAGRPRLHLGFLHPLTSALLIAMAIAFTLNTSLSMVAKGAAFCSLGALLWLCDARGITVGLTIAMLVALFLNARPSLLKSWIGFAVILMILGGGVLAMVYVDFNTLVAKVIGEEAATLNGRTDLWAYVFNLALDNALLGVGYYATRLQLLPVFPFAGHAHNSFLEVFLSTGLPGALLFVAFLALCIARLARTTDPLLAALLPVLLIEGNLNPVLFTPGLAMLLLPVVLFIAEEPAMRKPGTGVRIVGRSHI
ncbi:O-antigen ligase family protein [Dankookia sp. P2]|uniref:O-antigen ligase family protein n=1 Tax=Dankookia sp. P2 TaxID=3423955 RepID=UPI003D66DA2B